MTNLPDFFTSAAATVAKVSRNFAPCDFLSSAGVATASASAPLVMGLLAAFIAGAFIAVFTGQSIDCAEPHS